MKLTIIRQAHFTHPRSMDNKALRQLVKSNFDVAVRRMDNFTLAGLAAVAKLKLEVSNPDTSSLVSCAPYFSVELVQKLIIDGHSGKSIRPLDFVSTVGNAANFYIAKEFNIHGSNLFLGADKQALEKALLVSSIEVISKPSQRVIILLWQETQSERNCYALLAQNAESTAIADIENFSFDAIRNASNATPFVIDIREPNSQF
ncbi:MAG: hypothetical protein ABJK64_05075 [Paraglaciecola sp.]|uniref:hypothetical protein n=1 Tax=Paraglaciecola sp. TaxID=1920173 RepID=UPI003299CC36